MNAVFVYIANMDNIVITNFHCPIVCTLVGRLRWYNLYPNLNLSLQISIRLKMYANGDAMGNIAANSTMYPNWNITSI